jgi:uncharacterized protein
MDLSGQRRSENVDDQRSGRATRRVALGGGSIIVVVLIGTLLGADPQQLLAALGNANGQPGAATQRESSQYDNDAAKVFVERVLASTEDTWNALFRQAGAQYPAPVLVLFRDRVESACGSASSSTGPFYCPGDRKVYLDLSFFDDLSRRFKAPGDFAQAYVIAHEIGHHVQNVTGAENRMRQATRRADQATQNAASVRLELQADCYAGVWAHHAQVAKPFLERGDLEEALSAATAIGDDRLQKQAQGYVVPESFTHGSSAQRVKWFSQGLKNGSIDRCDTFSNQEL